MSTAMEEWVVDQSLNQNTVAWRSARRRRVGGSDISVIMRISPYKTRYELWEEKTGRREVQDISRSPHVKRGVDAEPIARRMLERRHRVTYSTPVIVHRRYDWAVASVDGLCPDHVLEIKTMSLEGHLNMRDGIVPEHYRMQLLWGLECSGKKKGIIASFRPEDGSLYEVVIERDKALQAEMIQAAEEFIGWVRDGIEPPDECEVEL
jgi:putative phage-type endonuclease